MSTLKIHLNTSNQDMPFGSSGVEYTEISSANDFLIFTGGSDTVSDGEAIPSSFQLSQAGVVLNGTQIIIPHYILADISANELKEAFLMGNTNKRYVLAFEFDGATTSEPVLEAWDNSSMNTVNLASLGAGTPSSSWLKGIVTTDSLPGENWVGYALAGSSNGHFLWLNNENGAVLGADVLYCNLKMVIPATQTVSGAETPILVCKYTTV